MLPDPQRQGLGLQQLEGIRRAERAPEITKQRHRAFSAKAIGPAAPRPGQRPVIGRIGGVQRRLLVDTA